MNMLPGDTKALSPSGLRLGVPELTRVGMGADQMDQVAHFFQRALIDGHDLNSVKADVESFKDDYTTVNIASSPARRILEKKDMLMRRQCRDVL